MRQGTCACWRVQLPLSSRPEKILSSFKTARFKTTNGTQTQTQHQTHGGPHRPNPGARTHPCSRVSSYGR
jgi:hypothetical protein